jgi:hypothetical protein
MKKNRLVIISVILLAIVALVLILTRSNSTIRKQAGDFAIDDTATVTRIFMSDKNNTTLTLQRESPSKWLVNGKYAGSLPNITMLLQTMLHLEVMEPVANAAHNTVIRNLAARSVKVEIYQKVYRIDLFGKIRLFPHEKLTKVYYVGTSTQNNRGTYMLIENSDTPYVVGMPGLRGFVSPRYTPVEKYWRDYIIFRKYPGEIASIRVEIPALENESFILENTGKQVVLKDLNTGQDIRYMDTLAVYNFLTGFRKLNYEALLNDMPAREKDSILASQPFFIITLTDTAGAANTIKMFHKAAPPDLLDMNGKPMPYDIDRLYALVNDGQDFVLVQFFLFDRVLRPKSFFLKKDEMKK